MLRRDLNNAGHTMSDTVQQPQQPTDPNANGNTNAFAQLLAAGQVPQPPGGWGPTNPLQAIAGLGGDPRAGQFLTNAGLQGILAGNQRTSGGFLANPGSAAPIAAGILDAGAMGMQRMGQQQEWQAREIANRQNAMQVPFMMRRLAMMTEDDDPSATGGGPQGYTQQQPATGASATASAAAGGGGGAAGTLAPGIPDDISPMAKYQFIRESAGGRNMGDPAHAFGPAQFMPDTWMQFYADHKDAFPAGLSQQAILDMRADPHLSALATDWMAQNSAVALHQNGLPATPPLIAAGHMLGQGDLLPVARAFVTNPNTLLATALGPRAQAVMPGNNLPPSMTVGQFIGGYSDAPNVDDGKHPYQLGTHAQPPPSGPGPWGPGPMPPEVAMQLAANARKQSARQFWMGNQVGATNAAEVAKQLNGYALDVWKQRTAPSDLRPGGVRVENGQVTGENPMRSPALGPNNQPGTALLRQDGSQVPGSWTASGPIPTEEIAQKGMATQFYSPEEQKKLDANYGTLTQLDYLGRAADQLNQNRNFLQTGPGAEARTQIANGINTALNAVGLPTLIDPTNVAMQQVIAKNAFKLSTESLASQFGGSREAGFIIQKALSSVPNGEQNPMAFQYVLNAYRQAATREIDMHNFTKAWGDAHHNDVVGAAEAFNAQHPWQKYSDRAWSQVTPIELPKGVDPRSRLLPGSQFRTPDMPPGIALRVPGPAFWSVGGQAQAQAQGAPPLTQPSWPMQPAPQPRPAPPGRTLGQQVPASAVPFAVGGT
jgi:hypothetical protein